MNGQMITEESFLRLVAEDVKNKVSDHQKSYLRLPENWDRWESSLQSLVENLNEQLDELTERLDVESDRLGQLGPDGVVLLAELEADVDQRQKKIVRFKFYVESRLDEVARLRAIGSGPDPDASTASFFRRAIEKHREMINSYDMEYSEVDEALWAAVEGHWKFDDVVIEDEDDE